MDKRYEPLIIEEKWSELWAKNNLGKNNSSQTFFAGYTTSKCNWNSSYGA